MAIHGCGSTAASPIYDRPIEKISSCIEAVKQAVSAWWLASISHTISSEGVQDGASDLFFPGRKHCQNDKESPGEDKDDATNCADLPRECEKCGPGSSIAAPRPLEINSWRVRCGAELIAQKLQKQFDRAQRQAAQEPNGGFCYLNTPQTILPATYAEKVDGLNVGVCHFIGRRAEMEDEHLATSFRIDVQGRQLPVQVFGIFDGHSGGQASVYVRDHLESTLRQTLLEFCSNGLSDEAIWNALKITFVKLNSQFQERPAGTTATMAMILDGKLWTANVGDSRTILDNGVQLSEDAKPSDPAYRKGIEKRGGFVLFGRVNGGLAVARAIGDHDYGKAVSARPKITAVSLAEIPKGSHLILTCDGIYDVASTRQIASAVRRNRNLSAEKLAHDIVFSAYIANSYDNLSALVVKL